MAEELDVEILEEKLLSNPEAYKLLKKAVDKIQEREGSVSMLLSKTLHYLSEFSKMEPESSEALRNVLKNMDLKDETIIMIINICPQTLDELRILFELEEKVIDTETAQQILETIKPYCKE
ncbi:DNA-directed RNA polymerase, subunit F [Staphylothermus marinus F1]|uniref:DNA-directed RNA polymerase subunit Rpo4 n=1 Tax=Staphylothermus marinus (strain ATCC 43588 / DSM 3639 / JCM 9404 / F1) TaxID=399550 RepID=A3DML7_STAMF|nr:RNA polymerase Rpb4 family protein [Staphylothermus marinus]ABN69877.1 DNA-directed RNA polymerase, subunit F [Staphylothermus marinus F1]